MRSQLKKQIDEKNPSAINNPALKEPHNKPEKKQGLTVSNSKPKPCACPDTDKGPVVKQNQAVTGGTPAKILQSNTALSSLQAPPTRVNITGDTKGNAVKTADSSHAAQAVATSAVNNDAVKQESPQATPRPIKQEYQDSKTWSNKAKAVVLQPTAMPTEKQDKRMPSEQFQVASSQQNTNYRCIKVMSSDEETSARTNTVYTKNTADGNNSSKQSLPAGPLQRVSRVAHDGSPMSSPPQQLNTVVKGREIIDLTSDDSPPRPQSKSHPVSHIQGSQGNQQDGTKVPRSVSGRDTDGRRHASKSQLRKENHDHGSSRHHSIRDMQPSKEMSSVYDVHPYNIQPQVKPKVSPQLPESSPVSTIKRNLDEVYPSLKQEMSLPKHDKKRHQQARVESMEGRFSHSPSSDSVDEHFAEWLRRQSSAHQQSKPHVCHQRHAANPELGKLKYSYVTDDMCPPDCPCSLPTSRKDEILSIAPPKPKKEHYEEDLPFAGMTLYPGRWSPTMLGADHPDLYISSHAAHLPAPTDSLASHMCTASRIFIPTAQIFSPPYHLGVPPVGAPPLIGSPEDQLHIHPHCLMASSYPCTSTSRAPDGAVYPLYSYT